MKGGEEMVKCIDCKFLKQEDPETNEGTCFNVRIKDVRTDRECKYFQPKSK